MIAPKAMSFKLHQPLPSSNATCSTVIPAIESRLLRESISSAPRASWPLYGGGQSLNFGLTHLDTFAWVGGFSSAPNTKAPEELVPEPRNQRATQTAVAFVRQ